MTLPWWTSALWAAAFVVTLLGPGIIPTAGWTLLLLAGFILGLATRTIPVRGGVLTVVVVAVIVAALSHVALGPWTRLGGYIVPLALALAAAVALALRRRLRRAVTVRNVLVSGGLGAMLGIVLPLLFSIYGAATRTAKQVAAGELGESLVWSPFVLVMVSALPLIVFALGYVAAPRRWRQGRAEA